MAWPAWWCSRSVHVWLTKNGLEDPALGVNYLSRRAMFARLAESLSPLVVGTETETGAHVHHVSLVRRAARDEVEAGAGPLYFVAAVTVELDSALGAVVGCGIFMAVNLLVRLAGLRGVATPAGPFTFPYGLDSSYLVRYHHNMQAHGHKEVRVREDEWLSLQEAMRELHISEPTARRWIKSGKLKAAQPGRRYLIPRSAVEDLLQADSPKEPAYPQGQAPNEELDRWLEEQGAHLHAMYWHKFLALVDSSNLAELEDLHSQFREEGDVIDISTRQRKPKEERTPLDYNLLDRTPLRDLVLTFSLITRRQRRNVSAKEAASLLVGAAGE